MPEMTPTSLAATVAQNH